MWSIISVEIVDLIDLIFLVDKFKLFINNNLFIRYFNYIIGVYECIKYLNYLSLKIYHMGIIGILVIILSQGQTSIKT